MATYAPRPDGLLEVTLDDGRRMPTALDPVTLEAQGIYAQAPELARPPGVSPEPDLRTAGLGNLGTPAQPPGMSDLGASPAFGQLMGAGAPPPQPPPAPIGPPAPPPPPTGNMSVMPEAGMSRAPPPAPAPAPASEQPPGPGALERDISRTAQEFMLTELARGAAPAQRIPGGERREGYELKYKDYPAIDPQVYEDIGESRIDQQLASQDTAEQEQYGRSMLARVAARNATQAQKEYERALVRKQTIEQEVGERTAAIDARIAKARAVTEQGSARERVMKGKGTFGRILATIGIALGEFSRPYAGGRNPVEERINQEVAEEAEREKELYNVDPERSALRDLVDFWGSPQMAQKEYELHAREAVQAQLEAWARRADEQSVPVAFRQWLADQALALQQARAQLNEAAAVDVVEKYKNVPDKYVGGGGVDPLKAAERASKLTDALRNIHGVEKLKGEGAAHYRKYREQGVVQLPDGRLGWHPSQTEAVKVEKAAYTIPSWRKNLEEMRDIYRSRGVATAAKLNPTDRARLSVLAARSVPGVKSVAEEALTLGEYTEVWGKLSGNPEQAIFRISNEAASLDEAIKATEQFELDNVNRLRQVPPDIADDLPPPLVPRRPPSFREVK